MQPQITLTRSRVRLAGLALLAFVTAGCGASTTVEYPAVNGRRVQGTRVVADGAVPYQVRAYELVFTEPPGAARHARRAALHVDLVDGQGFVQGFAEWGRPGETPKTYAVGGWARQRDIDAESVTVFELTMNYVQPRPRPARAPALEPADRALAVRVVVNEASGDVTLTTQR